MNALAVDTMKAILRRTLKWTQRVLEESALFVAGLIPARLMSHSFFLLRSHPKLTDRWGRHIRPIHYYEPLPDFRKIRKEDTQRRHALPGIDIGLAQQVLQVATFGRRYGQELEELASIPAGFDFNNPWFAGLDAILYYSIIRELRPSRVIEIGCGYSTRVAAKALAINRQEGNHGKLICIEPYPEPRLLEAKLDIELIETRVEEMPVSFFASLQTNDILFVDSSHAARFGGDVNYELLELIPTLNPGVWIHVHDIFFPTDYPEDWLIEKRWAFNEQYLLTAFLMFNSSFKPQYTAHWLLLDHEQQMRAIWPGVILGGSPTSASFWMKRTK